MHNRVHALSEANARLPGLHMQPTFQTPLGVNDVFTQQGGYRVGRSALLSFNASWPFGSIEVRSGQLALHCITRTLDFPVSKVTSASIYYGLFSVGVRVEHTIANYPRFVVFWTRDPDELMRRLKDAGYPIQ